MIKAALKYSFMAQNTQNKRCKTNRTD